MWHIILQTGDTWKVFDVLDEKSELWVVEGKEGILGEHYLVLAYPELFPRHLLLTIRKKKHQVRLTFKLVCDFDRYWYGLCILLHVMLLLSLFSAFLNLDAHISSGDEILNTLCPQNFLKTIVTLISQPAKQTKWQIFIPKS